ncbi:MAG: hypothetical protein EOO77_08410 [Oxalobacteraceae bacterium]|nr:MAG: hypothetical protein EOO77_08410 [Oxalobacteraceae bacterium]
MKVIELDVVRSLVDVQTSDYLIRKGAQGDVVDIHEGNKCRIYTMEFMSRDRKKHHIVGVDSAQIENFVLVGRGSTIFDPPRSLETASQSKKRGLEIPQPRSAGGLKVPKHHAQPGGRK